MRKICIATACILVILSSSGFAKDASNPVEKTVSQQTQVPPITVPGEASENQPPMSDIHDIKPLVAVPVPVSWATVALWTAVVTVVGGILLGAWLFRRRRSTPSIETAEAVLSPEETALQRLAALSEEIGMEGKRFYFQLSFIFREYLEGRFGIDGIEMTTEELLPHVEKLTLDRILKQTAKKFIVSCDPVKYAGAPVFQASMAADFAFVKSFVETTTASAGELLETKGGQAAGFSE